jgi:hypothetical protein
MRHRGAGGIRREIRPDGRDRLAQHNSGAAARGAGLADDPLRPAGRMMFAELEADTARLPEHEPL